MYIWILFNFILHVLFSSQRFKVSISQNTLTQVVCFYTEKKDSVTAGIEI